MKSKKLWAVCLLLVLGFSAQAASVSFFNTGSLWRFRLGTNEASSPVTEWRTNLNDAGWSALVPAGIGYGSPPTPATIIPASSATTPNYLSVFLRRTFVVNNAANVASATLTIIIDDGAVVWINGVEVARQNVPAGTPSIATAAPAAIETETHTFNVSPSVLREGNNVIAIQAINANVTSSDLYIDASLTGVIDDVPPAISFQLPFAGSTVPSLTQIQVGFSEDVSGVNASDLLINGSPATNVTVLSASAYQFRFPPPPTGPVTVQFAPGHGIQDLAATPNAFAGASWNYTIDPNVVISEDVRINEFVAVNVSGLRDEDNDFEDWVELRNLSTNLVSIAGWSLTDNPNNPDKWVFPAVMIQPSGYLIVFCSGKDRKPTSPNARLHTNFKLGAEGEFLGLFNADSPRKLISSFESYPVQRRDYSYGYDPLGALKYFTPPTPGSNNPPSSITGVVAEVGFSHQRGFYGTNFSLSITCATPGVTIRYTLDGRAPTTSFGTIYSGPIEITNTTVVRAFAYRTGFLASDITAHTYLFLSTVPTQAANGQAPAGWPTTWGGNVVDYGMDPDIVNNLPWRDMIHDSLRAIPSFSIVINQDDMFSSGSGIYANPGGDGPGWERPCSIELLNPDGAPGFQINCGIRIRGGFSRSTDNPKHAFRFFFRQEYGAGRLNFPFFGPTGAESFDKFDMRTMQNYSWSFQNDGRMMCLRDVMSRDAQLAMNGLSTRGNFYHLYINGMYWGMYNSEERPEAAFAESYIGGDADDYDTIKQLDGYISGPTDGNTDAWYRLWGAATNGFASNTDYFKVQGRNADGSINPSFENLVDVPNLIDYMLVILYGGNLDAPISAFLGNDSPNNWYGVRDRTGQNGGFRFISHDAEHTLLNVNEDRTGIVDLSSSGGQYGVIQPDWTCGNPLTQSGGAAAAQQRSTPQYIWFRMHQNPEFRMLAADRIFKHCFNGGPLSVEGIRSAFLTRSNEIQLAIVAESARWGDAKNPIPYNRNSWLSAMNGVASFMNGRTAVLLNQLRNDGLYPSINPPSFNSSGGVVSNGFVFNMVNGNPSGTVYYTVDGTDPRQIGGSVAPSAIAYSGPFPINFTTTIRTRVLSGGVWSAINEITFYPPQDFSKLLVSEIMYHPPMIGAIDGDEFEFLELKNTGSNAVSLSGLTFSGISYTFPPDTILGPAQFHVLVANNATFNFKYPGVTVNGVYNNRLANSGETISLFHPLGAQVLSFTFGDLTPWPVTPDGFDFSLVPKDATAAPDYDEPGYWRASSARGGSPGADDPLLTVPPVVINEVLTHSETGVDFIELYNPTTNTVEVGGWFLTDDPATPKKFRIPNGTTITPMNFVVFDETHFNATPGTNNSFSLNSHGDDVYLFSGDSSTNLTGYDHGFSFDAALDGETFGRYVVSTGEEQFPRQLTPSPGAINAGPRIGPVVINEVHYNPAAPFPEFVELKNISSNAVPLFDATLPTNTWRVNGLGYTFPPNITLPAGGFVLLAPTNLAEFSNHYTVPPGLAHFGIFAGNLQNSGERLELQQPETSGTNGVGFVTIDAVRYNDRAPWPPAADGSGPSLHRIVSSLYGNDPVSWTAAIPTPGGDYAGGDAPVIIAQPQSKSGIVGSNVTFSVTVTGTPPFSFVWRLNGTNLPGANEATLLLTNVQSHQAGKYSVNVFNSAGFVTSTEATLLLVDPVTFTLHPVDRSVQLGMAVTLTSTATGSGVVRYQWRLEGTNIPNATNSFYSIAQVSAADHGVYSVIATDDISTAVSSNALLFVLISPGVVVPPAPQTVLQGGTAIFSCVATGGPPLFYRWISNAVQFTVTTEPQLVLHNVQPRSTTLFFRVVVTNLAGSTTAQQSPNVRLTVLSDFDGDGMADVWEAQNGFNTNNAADALLDGDGDGMINRSEYVAGTDPDDATSLLKMLFSTTNAAALNFTAQTNIGYTVQWRTNLSSAQWNKLTNIEAGTTVREIQVDTTQAPAAPQRYFRVVTPLIP